MDQARLLRVFHRIVLASLPVASAAALASCASSSSGAGDQQYFVTSCGEVLPLTNGPYGTSHCHSDCYAFEGDPANLADAAAGPLGGYAAEVCAHFCGDAGATYNACGIVKDGGLTMMECSNLCTGRRPPGLLAARVPEGPCLGTHFTGMAQLEAASVSAFRTLRAELDSLRAPRSLVRGAGRAARDEVRHARAARALSARFGGTWSPPVVEPVARRSLEQIAFDNAVEGCVREAFGALVATRQARTARDPVIRATMVRIARDETRHAALAFGP
jgi:hypothetical protein